MNILDAENVNEKLLGGQNKPVSKVSDLSESIKMLFDTFKESSYYTDSISIDINWLNNRLSSEELEELEVYILATILDIEEETFIGSSRFLWSLYKELSINV